MKKQNILAFMLTIIFTCSLIKSEAQNIREIAAPNLPDIAMASYDAFGPVIYFNPTICNQIGPLATSFFKAHEYGHHNLGHILRRYWNANDPYAQAWLNANMENEADAYALRYWLLNKPVIQAWVNTMWSINNSGDLTHAPSRVRAENITNLYFSITHTALFP